MGKIRLYRFDPSILPVEKDQSAWAILRRMFKRIRRDLKAAWRAL